MESGGVLGRVLVAVLLAIAVVWLVQGAGRSPTVAAAESAVRAEPPMPPWKERSEPVTTVDRGGRRPTPALVGAGSRRVFVLDGRSREPVAGAEIRFVGADRQDPPKWPDWDWLLEHGRVARSDADGRAVIQPHPESGRVVARADERHGWTTLGGLGGDPLVFVLERVLEFAGQVTDRAGHPIPGVLTELWPVTLRRDGIVTALETDWLWEFSDADGRLRFDPTPVVAGPFDTDALGRPRVQWQIVWLDEIRRGLVEWDRPWTIVAPDTAWIGIDVVVPEGEADAQHVPRRSDSGDAPVEGARELPPGLEDLVATKPGTELRFEFRSADGVVVDRHIRAGPSGSTRIERAELPWRSVVLTGRLVPPSGRSLRLPASVCFATGSEGVSARTDAAGRFEAYAWLSPATRALRVDGAQLEVRSKRRPVLRLEPCEFEPGRHDLGDLVVEGAPGSRPVGLLAEVRLVGPAAATCEASPWLVRAPQEDGAFHPDRDVEVRQLDDGRFAFHGPIDGGDFLEIAISTPFAEGSVPARVGDRDIELRPAVMGRVEVEILVPGRGGRGMAAVRFEPDDDAAIEGSTSVVGPGRLRASVRVPPGRGRLSVVCGPLELLSPRTVHVEPGSVVRWLGPDAVDLRHAFRHVRFDLVDVDGGVAEVYASLSAWESTGVWRLNLSVTGPGVVDAWIPRSVRDVVVEPTRAAPILCAADSARTVVVRPRRDVSFALRLPGGTDAAIADRIRWSVAVVDDGFPAASDDPRREPLGRRMPRTDGTPHRVLQLSSWEGAEVEVCAWLRSATADREAPLARHRLRLDASTPRYVTPVTEAELDAARHALRR